MEKITLILLKAILLYFGILMFFSAFLVLQLPRFFQIETFPAIVTMMIGIISLIVSIIIMRIKEI